MFCGEERSHIPEMGSSGQLKTLHASGGTYQRATRGKRSERLELDASGCILKVQSKPALTIGIDVVFHGSGIRGSGNMDGLSHQVSDEINSGLRLGRTNLGPANAEE